RVGDADQARARGSVSDAPAGPLDAYAQLLQRTLVREALDEGGVALAGERQACVDERRADHSQALAPHACAEDAVRLFDARGRGIAEHDSVRGRGDDEL